jgi:nicotinamidase-related amidase
MGDTGGGIKSLVYEGIAGPQLLSGATALMIIDMTYKDAHPDYGLGTLLRERGWDDVHTDYYARVSEIIPTIQRVRAACREADVAVVNVRVAASAPDCSDIGRAFKRIGLQTPGIWCPPGSKEAEILDELAPGAGELTVSKTTGSVFNSTNIDWTLRNMGVETLIAAGVVTNGCVEGSVRDAADLGYEVVLLSDGTTALTRDEHDEALQRLAGGPIYVRSADEVIAAVATAAAV